MHMLNLKTVYPPKESLYQWSEGEYMTDVVETWVSRGIVYTEFVSKAVLSSRLN